jgi:hypothetical protein
MAVIKVARQRRDMSHELAVLAALDRCCDRDLDAEFLGLAGFAFADALHLRCGQAEYFLTPLTQCCPLCMDPLGQAGFGVRALVDWRCL